MYLIFALFNFDCQRTVMHYVILLLDIKKLVSVNKFLVETNKYLMDAKKLFVDYNKLLMVTTYY